MELNSIEASRRHLYVGHTAQQYTPGGVEKALSAIEAAVDRIQGAVGSRFIVLGAGIAGAGAAALASEGVARSPLELGIVAVAGGLVSAAFASTAARLLDEPDSPPRQGVFYQQAADEPKTAEEKEMDPSEATGQPCYEDKPEPFKDK